MNQWRIYYADGTVHDAIDGLPPPDKRRGVAGIWQDQPHQWCYSGDYFLWLTDERCWLEVRGIDFLVDQLLCNIDQIGCVLLGRNLSNTQFARIQQQMNAEHHERRKAALT